MSTGTSVPGEVVYYPSIYDSLLMGSFWPEQFVYYCSAYDLMFRNEFCNKYKQIYIGSTDSMFSPLLTRTVVPEGRSYPYPKMCYTQEMRDEAVPTP